MKIAIHHSSGSYSRHWIAYCEEKKIPYKIVNCYDSDIIKNLADCDALMWHHNHGNPKDVLFAKELLFSLEAAGKLVYPDSKTTWHFDDKLGQKYLLEALGLPLIPTFAFYSKKEALNFISTASFPIVFKLRGGAGSRNVKLIKNRNQAKKIIYKAFGKGIRQYNAWEGIKESIRKFRLGKTPLKEVAKAFAHIVYPIQLEKSKGREKGYVYFQKFLPECKFDIRVQIVNKKAWAMRRLVRDNDFRASGSDSLDYDLSKIPIEAVKLSFEIYKKLQVQTLAVDYLESEDKLWIPEISYAFGIAKGELDVGYWKENLSWHPGKINPFGWMVDEIIENFNARKKT